MKTARKIVLLLSSVILFILLANAKTFLLLLYGIIGILVGLQLGSIDWEKKRIKPVWLIIVILISGYAAYKAGRVFYITWQPSSMVKAILSRITADTDPLLNVLCHCAAAAAFPAMFALTRLLFDYLRKLIPILHKEYSGKPLISSRSAFVKSAGIVILNLFAAVVLGVVLLTAAYSLPSKNIGKNAKKSAEILQPESSYPILFSWCTSKLDNQDDAIMLAEASYSNSESSALETALMAYRGEIEGGGIFHSFVSHYISGAEYTDRVSYSRYWHGYHLFLNPLLEIMDYGGIRILNSIIQFLLVILVSVLLAKRNAGLFILPYIFTYLMLNPLVLGKSMQFSSCFYLFTFGIITLLMLPDGNRSKYAFLVFLNIGIWTAYFDFLTYPIAAFGIPAVLYIVLLGREREREREREIRLSGSLMA